MNFKIFSFILLMISLMMMMNSLYMIMNNMIYLINIMIVNMYNMNLYFYFYIDMMNSIFAMIILIISSMVFFYSESYMSNDKSKLTFIILTFFFVLNMLLMIFSMNTLMILIGWDGLGLTSYYLVIFYQNKNSNYAGMITIMTNRLGDISMILAMIYMMSYSFMNFYMFNIENLMMKCFIIMMIIAAMTKSAQYPFSAWLPAAMAAPTPISALVHSSTLVTAGVYLMIRLNLILNFSKNFSNFLMFISILTLFLGGFIALFEKDFKKIIALSTLSQLGLMMMMMSMGYLIMSFFHLITHAIFKSLLFLSAGIIIHKFYSKQFINSYNMNYFMNPFLSNIFLLSSFSLMGFPFLSGFYSKDLILEIFYINNMNYFLLLMLFLSTIFTILYSMRLFYFIFLNNKNNNKLVNNEKNLDYKLNFPLIFISIYVIFLGNFFSWFFFSSKFIFFMKLNTKLLNLFFIFMILVMIFMKFKNNMNMNFYFKYMIEYYSLNMLFMSNYFGKMSNMFLYYNNILMNMELQNEKILMNNQFLFFKKKFSFFYLISNIEMKYLIIIFMMLQLM